MQHPGTRQDGASHAPTRRFVLLEHRWNGVHFDLMLETEPGGPLRTWAIDAEIVRGHDLPARELTPHRAIYLDYEGQISGGRGTVKRLDRGEFTPLEWTGARVRVDLSGRQLVGEAELCRSSDEDVDGVRPAWIFRLGNLD